MWLSKLQIAIVEKNTNELDKLLDVMPIFKNAKEMELASYLLREAVELIYKLKDETAVAMSQLKKNMAFLRSSEIQTLNKLDIKL